MALSAIWITVASLIAAFDITKAVDENGETIELSHEYSHILLWWVVFAIFFRHELNSKKN
jgi:Na+-driven multidrug efflux pump